MIRGDRVQYHDEVEGADFPTLGTLATVSPAGYCQVNWDEPITDLPSLFSPQKAARDLRVVTGDAALPRHRWNPGATGKPWSAICAFCHVERTEANELEPCPQATSAGSDRR